MATIIYRLDFASGKSYVGICRRGRNRYREHALGAKRGEQTAVYRAWRKYGPPAQVVLAIVENADAPALEQRAIKAFGTLWPLGYNITPGGESSPMLVPEVRNNPRLRANMTKSQRARWASMSAEQKQELSRKCWATRRANGTDRGWTGNSGPRGRAAWNRGIPRAEETKRKISATLTGRIQTAETRLRLSKSLRAYWSTATEAARLHRGVNRGKSPSVETRRRMSVARQVYWKRRREAAAEPYASPLY